MSRVGDRLLGLLLLLLALAYGWSAQQWPEPFGSAESFGPETFPTILSITLTLVSLFLMFKPDPDEAWPVGKSALEIVMAVLALFVYAGLLELLGFILSTTIAVSFLSWRMGAKPLHAVLIALSCATGVFLLFNYLLDLPLPLGF
ncbi:MAG: tripartite tricarboxylate transporter TctB family protein [Reinekea sp.]|jgi:putative tricarboxylic transport membrane protein